MAQPGKRDRTPDPAPAAAVAALVASLGRERVARWCGVAPDTLRLWRRYLEPGLVSLELLEKLAEAEGFADVAEQLRPITETARRRAAWHSYQASARLFALDGNWPQKAKTREEQLRRCAQWVPPAAPRWVRRDEPPAPPDDFPEDRIAAVKASLERQGWTLTRGLVPGWHVCRLSGWRPSR